MLALQVHVALGSAERTLAVFTGLRRLLPEIAALAANAPFHGGVLVPALERRPVRELLTEMLGELEPYGRRLECAAELAGVGELIVANGAMRQRAIAAERGLQGLIGWLRERFTAPRLD